MALTPKQEAFVLAYLETGNATEAYRRAYDVREGTKDSSTHRRAKELLDNSKIAARIEELRKPAVQAAQLTLEEHLRELKQLSDEAKRLGQFGPAVTGAVARGKAAGLHVNKTELTGPGGVPLGADVEWRVTIVERRRA